MFKDNIMLMQEVGGGSFANDSGSGRDCSVSGFADAVVDGAAAGAVGGLIGGSLVGGPEVGVATGATAGIAAGVKYAQDHDCFGDHGHDG